MKVSRRGALKSIAALAMAPIIDLRPTIDRERLLLAFKCPYKSIRYDIDEPFGVGSLTYATDARKICRAEIANRIENGERTLPNVVRCWSEHWHPAGAFKPFDLPPVESLTLGGNSDFGTCPLCSGRRKFLGDMYPDWDWCDSWKARSVDYDVDTNTTLDPSCELCHGRTYHGPWKLRVDGVLCDYSELKPIAALPNVRITRSTQDSCLLFVADGFEGMAMGMHDD